MTSINPLNHDCCGLLCSSSDKSMAVSYAWHFLHTVTSLWSLSEAADCGNCSFLWNHMTYNFLWELTYFVCRFIWCPRVLSPPLLIHLEPVIWSASASTAAHHLPWLFLPYRCTVWKNFSFKLDIHQRLHSILTSSGAWVAVGEMGCVSHHPSVCHRLSPGFFKWCCRSVNKREKHQGSWGAVCRQCGRASLSHYESHTGGGLADFSKGGV